MRATTLVCALAVAAASDVSLARPLRLRGGAVAKKMSFQQGVLALTGSVMTLSGVATVLDPAWTTR